MNKLLIPPHLTKASNKNETAVKDHFMHNRLLNAKKVIDANWWQEYGRKGTL